MSLLALLHCDTVFLGVVAAMLLADRFGHGREGARTPLLALRRRPGGFQPQGAPMA